jgi:hypothetical protein
MNEQGGEGWETDEKGALQLYVRRVVCMSRNQVQIGKVWRRKDHNKFQRVVYGIIGVKGLNNWGDFPTAKMHTTLPIPQLKRNGKGGGVWEGEIPLT